MSKRKGKYRSDKEIRTISEKIMEENREVFEKLAEEEAAVAYLAEIGVPISPDGTPLGIGWDE